MAVVMRMKMDGKSIGIGIYSYKQKGYLKSKNGYIIWKNEALAKAYMVNVRKVTDPLEYDLVMIINDNFISLDIFTKIDNKYQMFSENGGIKYIIEPDERYYVHELGYIVFNNNERIMVEDKNYAHANATASSNFAVIRNAANFMVAYPNYMPNIEAVTRCYYNMVLPVKETTAEIAVVYNSQIMNINQNRSNAGKRVFRFDKDMDKYNTLYVYIRKDMSEPDSFGGIEKAKEVLNSIIDIAKRERPEIYYKQIDLNVPIEVEKDVIAHQQCKKKENENDSKC